MAKPSVVVGEKLAALLKEANRNGLKWDEVDGLSAATMSAIANDPGRRASDATLEALDAALGWAPGQARAVAEGRIEVPVTLDEAIAAAQVEYMVLARNLASAREGASEVQVQVAQMALERGENELADLIATSRRRNTPKAAVLDNVAVGPLGQSPSAGERPAGERATAVQVGAVRDFIKTMRDALDVLESAFEEDD